MNEKQIYIITGVLAYILFIVCVDIYFMHFDGINKSINQNLYSLNYKLKSTPDTSFSKHNIEKEVNLSQLLKKNKIHNEDKKIPSVDDEQSNENAPPKIITIDSKAVNSNKNTQSQNSIKNTYLNKNNSIYIRIGIFSNLKSVKNNIAYLKKQGYEANYQQKVKSNGKILYEFRVTKIKSFTQALKIKRVIDKQLKVNSKIIEP